ncbi:MAG: ABC-2 family transporter protein [Clostridia bacterium]|nr:ABC-2 family transporter protein [Clostridia bacterium]
MFRLYQAVNKHMKIYVLFMKNSLIGYMEYRANLFAALTMELVYLFSKILYVIAIYQTGIDINGVSPDEIMLFIGTYIIMTAIYTGLFMDNFYQLPEHIRNGTLDIYITKPLSLQFIATMRHVNFILPVPNLIAGITMVVLACQRLQISICFMNAAGYLLTLLSSTCIVYAVFLIPQILSFWTVKSGAITEIADRCWDFNNMPMTIYNKWMQRIGVFIIPVFFITNLPSMFLVDKLNHVYAVWMVIAPVVFLTLVRVFWNFAVRNYTSASS